MINVKGKTVQQVSDEIAAKLIQQGRRSMDAQQCEYQDSRGNHCSVGWLLEKGSEAMQFDGSLEDLIKNQHHLGVNDGFICENFEFLQVLQALHDSEKEDRPEIVGVDSEFQEMIGDIDMAAWDKWIN